MLIKIHDLPIKYPMEGISFHVKCVDETPDPIDRLWWSDGVMEVVLESGEVWILDFDKQQWIHTETVGV